MGRFKITVSRREADWSADGRPLLDATMQTIDTPERAGGYQTDDTPERAGGYQTDTPERLSGAYQTPQEDTPEYASYQTPDSPEHAAYQTFDSPEFAPPER